jgi:uncharacterized protein (DUF1330 family)
MTRPLAPIGSAASALELTDDGRAQQPVKKGYILIQVDVSDPLQYAEYAKVTPRLIEQFGGQFVARGGRTMTLEGPDARGRVVVVEFPTFERAQQFYSSAEYQAARQLRASAATMQMVLVEGL